MNEKMQYVINLVNIKKSDSELVGIRAVDLAELREKGLNVPMSFVVKSNAYEEFLAENNLKQRIDKALLVKEPHEAYKEILEMFAKSNISDKVKTEIAEAYEALTIDPGASASALLSKWDLPFVNVMRSPSYLLCTDDIEGLLQNIRGVELLFGAIKLAWASLYSPHSVLFRNEKGIKQNFGTGVIVQKMKKVKQSAIAYSYAEDNEKLIVVKGFLGMQDFSLDHEILGKDYHEVNPNSLSIVNSQINVQEHALERDFETEELVLRDLRGEGARQKIDDKQVIEIARLTKRAKSFLGKDLKIYFEIKDDYKYVLLACQKAGGIKRVVKEEEEAVIKVEEDEVKVVEQTKASSVEVVGGEDKLELPKILSAEEAKEEILAKDKYLARELCSSDNDENEFSKKESRDEFVKVVLENKADQDQDVIEKEVAEEVNLLQEILEIKEIIEKMEEHALNNSYESYHQEARKLKQLLKRVRE